MVMLNAQSVQSEDDISGKSRPKPGRYHMAVSHAEEKASKKKGTPGLECEFQVICDGVEPDGKTPTSGQSGKTIPMFLSYVSDKGQEATDFCIQRVTRLALVVGLLRAGEEKEPDWSEAIGRELIVEVAEGDYTDKSGNEKRGSEISTFGFWSLGNKAVANVPKDATSPGMQQLAKSGGPVNHPTASPANGGASKPATTPATTTAAAAPAKSKWADL